MVKIRKLSEIEPTLGFTEFDILEKYRQSFEKSELGRLHSLFPFSELAQQMDLHESRLGRKSYFSPEGKIALMVLKSYTNFSDSQLIEHLNGNIHYQLFCGVQIDPLHPLTNPKIVSAIRQELADRLDIESLQPILADRWKPYLENLHVCMTDANSYGKVLYGFIVICANIAGHCTYNVPVTSILMSAVPTLLTVNCVNAGNHRLVWLNADYFSYWKSYWTSWSSFIHPTGTG